MINLKVNLNIFFIGIKVKINKKNITKNWLKRDNNKHLLLKRHINFKNKNIKKKYIMIYFQE